jgi:hypothetical protein
MDEAFTEFLPKWQEAFRRPSDGWDGHRAVTDLKNAGYDIRKGSQVIERVSMLSFVRCDPEHRWRPREMLRRILLEVLNYRRQKRASQKQFADVELLLADIERRLKLWRNQVADAELKRLLANTADVIERRRTILQNFRSDRPFSPLGLWERLWEQQARADDIKRGIDLDSRLQVQAAKMFRTFLHKDEGVSLRTIARLVVLVYLVCGLANNRDGRLWIADSKHPITWRTVEDKLRRKGIR